MPESVKLSPKVSVIVPVYNAAKYLEQCLDSITNQTLREIEIICVNDGSTDNSLPILEKYAVSDPRFRIISRENAGSAFSRNLGIQMAAGEYLVFWDSDDFFEGATLQKVYDQCVHDIADVGIFGADIYDHQTKLFHKAAGFVRTSNMPAIIPFSRHDIPSHIFMLTNGAPWNKMYRREFICEKQITFYEDVVHGEDLPFVYLALAEARKITFVNQVLVHYRVNGKGWNYKTHKVSATVLEVFLHLKRELIKRNIFPEVERSFVNAALREAILFFEDNMHWLQLCTAKNRRIVGSFYTLMRREGFKRLGVNHHSRPDFYRLDDYDEYQKMKRHSWGIYLFIFLCVSIRNKLRTAIRKLSRVGKN